MIKILELLFALIIIVYLSRLSSALFKRANLNKAVKRLSKIEGVKIFALKNTYLSLLKPSAEAEYYLSIYGDEYLVRVYNGSGSSYAVHFAGRSYRENRRLQRLLHKNIPRNAGRAHSSHGA